MTSQGFRRGFTAAEKTELWSRWQRGESLKAIGRAFGKLCVTAKIVRVKDRFDVAQAVASEGRDLRYGCIGQRQAHDR